MRNFLMPALMLSATLSLASCSGGGGGSTLPKVAPTIVSVTPTNSSLGNADSTTIVITFSEPMDTGATQAAYNSASLGIRQAFGEVTYSWSPNHKVLTVIPNTALNYAIAPAPAQTYNYYISTGAVSEAGLFLSAQYNASFTTSVKHLNEPHYSDFSKDANISGGFVSGIFSVLFPSTSMVIGDDAANATQGAYLTFDLSSLPASVQPANILAANLKLTPFGPPLGVGSPYTNLAVGPKKLTVQGLFYGNFVDFADLLPNNELASNLDGASVATTFSPSVLGAVKADWTNRTTQGNLSQYQLRFAQIVAVTSVANQAKIFSGNPLNTTNRPHLILTYLADN